MGIIIHHLPKIKDSSVFVFFPCCHFKVEAVFPRSDTSGNFFKSKVCVDEECKWRVMFEGTFTNRFGKTE